MYILDNGRENQQDAIPHEQLNGIFGSSIEISCGNGTVYDKFITWRRLDGVIYLLITLLFYKLKLTFNLIGNEL